MVISIPTETKNGILEVLDIDSSVLDVSPYTIGVRLSRDSPLLFLSGRHFTFGTLSPQLLQLGLEVQQPSLPMSGGLMAERVTFEYDRSRVE
mgnify:CR=1 FL=1